VIRDAQVAGAAVVVFAGCILLGLLTPLQVLLTGLAIYAVAAGLMLWRRHR
jgi:hypothetical protein